MANVDKIGLPYWVIGILITLSGSLIGYVSGQAKADGITEERITETNRRLDKLETIVEREISAMQEQTVRIAELATELKSFNRSILAEDHR